MSLGGLAIAIGMLVDAAVVVVENVESQLADAQENLPTLHLIFRAAREVAAPVASGIVIIIVFLPLLTLQGLEGKMFGPVALTIVFALASSLLLSLTVVPVLASYLISAACITSPGWSQAAASTTAARLGPRPRRTYVIGALPRCSPPPAPSCCSARASCRPWTKAT
jgi:cobalt-zinc-cadmium resistance protein CzcA